MTRCHSLDAKVNRKNVHISRAKGKVGIGNIDKRIYACMYSPPTTNVDRYTFVNCSLFFWVRLRSMSCINTSKMVCRTAWGGGGRRLLRQIDERILCVCFAQAVNEGLHVLEASVALSVRGPLSRLGYAEST